MPADTERPLLPPVFLLGALALEPILHITVPVVRLIPTPWTWLGGIPMLGGLVVMVIGDRQFKRADTAISPFDRPSVLVCEGVFRISRNPMYLGMVAMLLGEAVALGSVTPMSVPCVFGVLVHFKFIRLEEGVMSEVFGDRYEEYRRRVRRWI